MNELSFLDTNVLVYTDDADAHAKRDRALSLVAELRDAGRGVISTQVLQEYFVAATRKLQVSVETAKRKTELFSHFDVIQITPADVLAAIDIHRLYTLTFWDALIVHAARSAKCRVLYSEDMSHGRVIGGIRIENPFLAST
jgi:predicted nucleic acid-binding protein